VRPRRQSPNAFLNPDQTPAAKYQGFLHQWLGNQMVITPPALISILLHTEPSFSSYGPIIPISQPKLLLDVLPGWKLANVRRAPTLCPVGQSVSYTGNFELPPCKQFNVVTSMKVGLNGGCKGVDGNVAGDNGDNIGEDSSDSDSEGQLEAVEEEGSESVASP
jgi:hypothetical protein